MNATIYTRWPKFSTFVLSEQGLSSHIREIEITTGDDQIQEFEPKLELIF